jgi:TRAP-type C4-dicarboxylate transport system substrate-binding protein
MSDSTTDKPSRLTRRNVIAAAGISGVTALAGCTGGDTGGADDGSPSYTINIGSTYEPGHILVRTAEDFKERIEAASDGRFSVTVTPGGSLGGEEDIVRAVQSESIEAQTGGGIPISMYAPEYYFVDTPFIIDDWDQYQRVVDSDAFQPALDKIIEQGRQRSLGVVYRGVRHFTANKPVRTPADVQGVNLRLPQLEDWVAIWEEIGASPTPVALDELYSALQQGVADASEGPAQQVSAFSLEEVQSHYSLTNHMIQTGGLYISEPFFQQLSADDQEMVLETGSAACEWASNTAIAEEESLIDGLEERGMTIVRDVDADAFRDAGTPAVERLFDEKYALSWDDVRNA